MWRWVVLWQVSTFLLVSGTLDFRFFNQFRQLYAPSTQVNCYEYTFPSNSIGRTLDKGIRLQKSTFKNVFTASTMPTFPTDPLLNINEISRRFDRLLPDGTDIIKEHAKLVQDINSLTQAVFVAPFPDENRDYDDSILHEIIETSTTTTPKPTTTRPLKTSKASSIPVILLGGASQRQVVRSAPLKFPKPTISLIGTSISPLMKHPYPFVGQASSQKSKPIKVCMTAMPTVPTTRRPSLWQRLINSLIPR